MSPEIKKPLWLHPHVNVLPYGNMKSSSHEKVGAPSFAESALLVFAFGAKGGFRSCWEL